MIYRVGDHILYQILDELYYAVVVKTSTYIQSYDEITVQTIFNFFNLYEDNIGIISCPSNLNIRHVKCKLPANLSKKEILNNYPEYLI